MQVRKYITYTEYLSQQKSGSKVCHPSQALPCPTDCTPQDGCNEPYGEQAVVVEGRVEELGGAPRSTRKGRRRARKEKGAKKTVGCFGSVVLALSFGVAVACALLVSKGLGLGHLRGEVTRIELPARSVYCVQIASPATAEEAASVSRDTRAKGGGGYIAMSDGVYLVMASAYAREEDCDSVITKLSYSDVTAAKYVLNIPAVTLDVEKSDERTAAVKAGYGLLWETYEALYALSVALDEGEQDAPTAKLAVGKLSEEYGMRIEALEGIVADTGSVTVLRIKSELLGLRNVLDGIYLDLNNDATLSGDLKYAYLKVLWAQSSLARELA